MGNDGRGRQGGGAWIATSLPGRCGVHVMQGGVNRNDKSLIGIRRKRFHIDASIAGIHYTCTYQVNRGSLSFRCPSCPYVICPIPSRPVPQLARVFGVSGPSDSGGLGPCTPDDVNRRINIEADWLPGDCSSVGLQSLTTRLQAADQNVRWWTPDLMPTTPYKAMPRCCAYR